MPVPDAMARRELLYGAPKRTPDYQALAKTYLAAGRQTDAMEAIDRVTDEAAQQELRKVVREAAIKAGNYFMLLRLHGKTPLDSKQWLDAYDSAKAQGKLHYALKIAREVEDEALIREAEDALGIAPPEPAEGEAAAAEASGDGDAEAQAPAE